MESYRYVDPGLKPLWPHTLLHNEEHPRGPRHFNPRTACTMSLDTSNLDAQIAKLREGNTLSENEVKDLCERVSLRQRASLSAQHNPSSPSSQQGSKPLPFPLPSSSRLTCRSCCFYGLRLRIFFSKNPMYNQFGPLSLFAAIFMGNFMTWPSYFELEDLAQTLIICSWETMSIEGIIHWKQ